MYVTCLCTIIFQITVTGIYLLSMIKFSYLKGGGGGEVNMNLSEILGSLIRAVK